MNTFIISSIQTIPLLGIDPIFCEMITHTQRVFIPFILAKDCKQVKCMSKEEWTDKSQYVHPMILTILNLQPRCKVKMKRAEQCAQCVHFILVKPRVPPSVFMYKVLGDAQKMVMAAPLQRKGWLRLSGGKELSIHNLNSFVPY